MATIPKNDYTTRVDSTDPNFPQGKAINLVGAVVGTGTPVEEKWVNDVWGFQQAILNEANITPSGAPDQVGTSQYLDSLKKIHKEDQLTTLELISNTTSYVVGTVITTSGFTTAGDGGKGDWKQNGTTAQTPSQSPAQLSKALLNDGSGNQWAIVTNGKPPSLNSLGAVTSQSLSGADSVADSYPLVIAVLEWCTTNNYLGIAKVLDSGYYRLSAPLYVNQQLLFEGVGKNESYFHADHLDGPAVRFGASNSGIRHMGVTGGATRRASAYSAQQIGVLFEGDDVPENDTGAPRLLHCVMEHYYIFGHPSSGIHIVGPAFTGILNYPDISTMKGHGISMDRGELTGRTNLITITIGGVCRIGEGRINICGGNAIALGSPTSAFSTPCLRVEIDNIEGGVNATDPAVRYFNAPVYMRGANHVYKNCGMDVQTGGMSAYVAGRNIHLKNNRMLGGYAAAYTIGSYDELPTEGIFIDGISVIGPDAPLDPAIVVTLPAGETIAPKNIHINQGEMFNITTLVGTDATLGNGDFRRVGGLKVNGDTPIAWKASDTVVNNSTSLVFDTELRTWLSANERVYFEMEVEYESTTTADIRLQIYGPAAAVFNSVTTGSVKISTTLDDVIVQNTTTGLINLGGGGTGVSRVASIKGFIVTGASEGYIGLAFAQLAAEVSDTKVLAGISNLKVSRLIS